MKQYHENNKSLKGFNFSIKAEQNNWLEQTYNRQMKINMSVNLNIYAPTRNFFGHTLPRWYYPHIYPGYDD